MKKFQRKQCPECGRLVAVRPDGLWMRHSPTYKHPPPGAPMCSKSGERAT